MPEADRPDSQRPTRPILVVEDDASTRDALQALLELEGYPVVSTPDGQTALAQLHAGLAPSLILLDMEMPHVSGSAFRERQVADPILALIPTIVCSAIYDPDPGAPLLRGAPFLRKPIDFDILLHCIERHRLRG